VYEQVYEYGRNRTGPKAHTRTRTPTRQSREVDGAEHRPTGEDPEYLSRQLITYIGNKRALLEQIEAAVREVKRSLGKNRIRFFDLFSGSGVVSRLLKAHSSLVVSNDIEPYAAVISRCYLQNRSAVDLDGLSELVEDFNRRVLTEPLPKGFFEELYAPHDEERITKEDRVFYTKSNARRIDNYRRLIETAPAEWRDLLLGPLLSEASIHANTAGVFKGFYKNRHTKVGQFGGSGSDALTRIMGDIELRPPVLSDHECDYRVLREDASTAARNVGGVDLAYLDPPYNQHPYGSNYFMLNLVAGYRRPTDISRVSGIPRDWQRSDYNIKSRSLALFTGLVDTIDAPFLLVSFNNEGFITPREMDALLRRVGEVKTVEMRYNAFRGSRSFANRPIHVTERLFLVRRK
jgi:adenine-specific DNA-methyltransferase